MAAFEQQPAVDVVSDQWKKYIRRFATPGKRKTFRGPSRSYATASPKRYSNIHRYFLIGFKPGAIFPSIDPDKDTALGPK